MPTTGRSPFIVGFAFIVGSAFIMGFAALALVGCAAPPAPTTASAPSASAKERLDQAPSGTPTTLNRGPAHPDRATIIDGSWLIGADYPPALYLLPTAVTRCHWRIVDFTTGTLIEEGRYAGPGPAAIWVGDGDLFQSEGCLLWQGYPQLTGSRDGSVAPMPSSGYQVGDGNWSVGSDMPAGRYRSDRAGRGPCSYTVHRVDERDDESYESTGTVRSIPAYLHLTLSAGDHFITRDCGTWTLIDETSSP